jgi:hypothetical protein
MYIAFVRIQASQHRCEPTNSACLPACLPASAPNQSRHTRQAKKKALEIEFGIKQEKARSRCQKKHSTRAHSDNNNNNDEEPMTQRALEAD